ncbi:ERAD-associated E3 ubiquitin-protein ligase HRD1B-like [Aristolochia californica]|uniref:ERAD-associated E3 ubiquitin-protein ligase HRD1B-like n=1 Tax=Aristolochia californica TaxID=171875 RepID=UPI0035E2501E
MIRLRTYAGFSLLGAIAIVYHAFRSRGQFYPATVYLSTSKISLVLLMNMGMVIMCTMWQLTKSLFLGSLREAEVERLNEQSWRELMEILFAITIFRQDFSVSFLTMVTVLLLIKALHWLCQKRVEYIETTPSVPLLSHVRIVSFMGFLLLLDSLFLYRSLKYLIETWRPSVSLFFSFEYMILATTTVSTFVKYVFYVSDMLMEGQWEKKAIYTFYLELIRDLLHLSMYLFFFLTIFVNYGVPLHLIRELYETFRNFKIRVADYIRYRKITSNMNDRFPDATPEELNVSDATCIICREEMVTAKKLLCGHLFHVHCLRSWLERQHTCPTCRALVVPPENTATRAAHGVQSDPHRHGMAPAAASTQGSPAGGAAGDALSQHQARLQAAATAAAIYGKSFVYPYPNTISWPSGYAFYPPVNIPATGDGQSGNTDLTGDAAISRQTQEHQNSGFPQLQHNVFGAFQMANGNTSNPNVSSSLLEAQERFLRLQIEALQNQLQDLRRQQQVPSGGEVPSTSDSKGKAPVAGAASMSDCGRHGNGEDTETV